MSLNSTSIESTVKAAVKSEFVSRFGGSNPPKTEEEISEAMAIVIAKVVPSIIAAIKTDADLSGVMAGADTVSGGVD